MATFGVATWDANGNPNNYGIKPSVVVGYISLSSGQVSGTYNFTVPTGCKLSYAMTLDYGTTSSTRRKISISGGTVSISSAGDTVGANIWPASQCELVIFTESA
ncbi:TPA: hypothetical protein ACPFPT_001106 [Escherichia coli]|uniref:hypothetical protein n=1 Tax=Escherichia coli TaxID=562 RepID=UPI000390E127|nr:hypothetical protein [Escherichia coli]EGE2449360.1 hypothetical protein [Escherichia coli]EQQ67208.1 hypothetical protein G771_01681 [Escherichia coli HVH 110 (4-6978754)]MCV0692304.1 hypothetical protein [Escherichia coli]MEC4632263.1 hypothetical protein [Escherichia coli]MWF02374.1 hypothetical protein [Escherichia coli]